MLTTIEHCALYKMIPLEGVSGSAIAGIFGYFKRYPLTG